MRRLPLLLGLIALICATAVFWMSDEDSPPDEVTDQPATIGRLRAGRAGAAGAGTVLPRSVTPSPRASSDPIPLAPPAVDGGPGGIAPPAEPTHSISGIVLRVADDSPLAGVRIRVRPKTGDPIDAHTSDDPPGRFTLTGVPLDVEQLALSWGGTWATRSAMHTLDPDTQDLTNLVLHFDSGFAVSGLVTDEFGAPIPGAIVDAERRGETVADATGRFVLRDVAPDPVTESVEIGARAPWYQHASQAVLVPDDVSQVPDVKLMLTGSGALEGVVTDAAGNGVAFAGVALKFVMTTQHGRSADEALEGYSSPTGRYRIDHVPPGLYIVQADAPDLERPDDESPQELVSVWIMDVDVEIGEATQLDIVLPQPSTLSGTVTDAYGTPIAGAKVLLDKQVRWPAPDLNGSSTSTSNNLRIVSTSSADGTSETVLTTLEQRTTTDIHGVYVLAPVMPGTKQLTVSDDSGGRVTHQAMLAVTSGQSLNHDIQLLTGLTLRSRVIDELGAPIEGANVSIQPLSSTSFNTPSRVHTDHEGRFTLTGLQPASMRLLILKPGYLFLTEEVDTTAPAARYVLHPAPGVNGRVLDALHEEPINAFTVTVKVGGNTWSRQSDFDDGIFKLEVNNDDRATVTISVPGYTDETFENIRPTDTVTRPLEFRMHRTN